MFIVEQLVHHWINISTVRVLTKLLMPSQIFIRSSEHVNANNKISLEAIFNVISVDLLLVPFVVFLALGLQVLNALDSHNLK